MLPAVPDFSACSLCHMCWAAPCLFCQWPCSEAQIHDADDMSPQQALARHRHETCALFWQCPVTKRLHVADKQTLTGHGHDSQRCAQVVMQAQRERPPSLSDCKDKFLVQTCTVPAGTPEGSAELFESRPPRTSSTPSCAWCCLGPLSPHPRCQKALKRTAPHITRSPLRPTTQVRSLDVAQLHAHAHAQTAAVKLS